MFGELIYFVMNSIDVYMLILSRVLGIVIIAPMFSRNNIPAMLKVGLGMILSYVILPFVVPKTSLDVSSSEFIFLILKELFTGFCIGLCMALIFNIFMAAGANADINIGLSMSQIFDSSIGGNTTISGQLFNVFAFLVFLSLDIHHLMIRAIVNSFEILPINTIDFYKEGFLDFLIRLNAYILISSILLVVPRIITLFLGNILLAFMAKVMPQMNVFIVGMPFKIIVGFVIFYLSLPMVKNVVIEIFKKMSEYVFMFLKIA